MPVHHFLVTFTVPTELRSVLRSSQADGYRALFDAGTESIRDVGSATRSLRGCQLGFFGVLHTWGRDPMKLAPSRTNSDITPLKGGFLRRRQAAGQFVVHAAAFIGRFPSTHRHPWLPSERSVTHQRVVRSAGLLEQSP